MSFLTNPSINGIQLPFNQLAGPLAKLFNNEGSGNYVYPADLTTNPALNHAIQFSFYDWNTPFQQAYQNLPDSTLQVAQQAVDSYQNTVNAFNTAQTAYNKEGGAIATNLEKLQAAATALENATVQAAPAIFGLFQSAFSATTYQTRKKRDLSKISLYLPDNLNASWDSNYNTVSMTQELGALGFLSSNADTIKQVIKEGKNVNIANLLNDPGTKELSTAILGKLGNTLEIGRAHV